MACSVWWALVLREATTRLSVKRGAWFWVIAEPVEQIAYLMVLHSLLRHLVIPNVSIPLFIGMGILPFVAMRSVAVRGIDAISANMALFSYRQIMPFDTVLARAVLEWVLYLMVGVLLIACCAVLGANVTMAEPLTVLVGFSLMAALGFGVALTIVAAARYIPDLGRMTKMAFGPLYLVSATMYPSTIVPPSIRPIFFLNPLAHGVEMVRSGYFASYRVPAEVSPAYLASWVLVLLALGLLLHVRFGKRLVEK